MTLVELVDEMKAQGRYLVGYRYGSREEINIAYRWTEANAWSAILDRDDGKRKPGSRWYRVALDGVWLEGPNWKLEETFTLEEAQKLAAENAPELPECHGWEVLDWEALRNLILSVALRGSSSTGAR